VVSGERQRCPRLTRPMRVCRITNIDPIDVMILPHDANLYRMEFSEGTAAFRFSALLDRVVIETTADAITSPNTLPLR
jgi:hypothetical protein